MERSDGDSLPDDREHQEFLDLTNNLNSISKSGALKKNASQDQDAIGCFQSPKPLTPKKLELVPHYLSKTTYIQNTTFRNLFRLSVIFSFAYFALRIVYIATGKVKVAVPDDSSPDTLREVDRQNRAALVYSTIILCAELGGFILVHVGQQMFTRQKTKFGKMPEANVNRMKQVVAEKGTLQHIHVIVCTYSEDAATVEKCVVRLLEATLPVYAERTIWVGDDGHAKPQGAEKRAMCEKLRAAGHNVRYVGDRARKAAQLNGKSSNLNHVLLSHIYPDVQHSNEVSWKDVIVVMDCDHLVEPAYFQKNCSVLLDKDVAVCLVPQAFHNLILPDFFDNRNANFMFRLMPYYFGAGCCFITGTNVMIRARACFLACQFGEEPTSSKGRFMHLWREKAQNKRARQLFSEVLIAEDIDLGSRIHALGYKSVFLDEVLARGEVPHAPRDFWKQRSRWHKAAHLYILDKHSVFWRKQPYMTFYQKTLYCIPIILHLTVFLSEPFMFTLPLVCLCFGVCPYGMDLWLWVTHFLKLLFNFLVSTHADTIGGRVAAIEAQTASRVLYFISVKAVLNTVMVYFRWKRPGAFKVTAKAGSQGGSQAGSQGGSLHPAPMPARQHSETPSMNGSVAASSRRGSQPRLPAGPVGEGDEGGQGGDSRDSVLSKRRRGSNGAGGGGGGAASKEVPVSAYEELDGMTIDTTATFEESQAHSHTVQPVYMSLKHMLAKGDAGRHETPDPGTPTRGTPHTLTPPDTGPIAAPPAHKVSLPRGPSSADSFSYLADGPNPHYSPRERLASTAVVQLEDRPLKAGKHRKGASLPPSGVTGPPPKHVLVRAGSPGADESSAANVGFASSSLNDEHEGVTMPQAHALLGAQARGFGWGNRDSDGPRAPRAGLRRFRSADAAESGYAQEASEMSSKRHNSAGPAHGHKRVGSKGSTRFGGRSRRNLSVVKEPPRRHRWSTDGPEDESSSRKNVYVPPEMMESEESSQPAPRTPSRTPSVPDGFGGSPVDDHASSGEGAGGGDGMSPHGASPSNAASCFVPAPPPGFQYALVPAAPPMMHMGMVPTPGGYPMGHMPMGQPPPHTHPRPHGLPAVLEGSPMTAHELCHPAEVEPSMGGQHGVAPGAYPPLGTASAEPSFVTSDGHQSAFSSAFAVDPSTSFMNGGHHPQQQNSSFHNSSFHNSSFQFNSGLYKVPSMNTMESCGGRDIPRAGSAMAGPVGEEDQVDSEMQPPHGYRYGLYCCHDKLSSVTERRKACMPYEGTLDFPVLFIITAMNFIALTYGASELAREGELISLRGTEEQNVKMIALVFALVETTPGFLFLWYMAVFRCCRWTLWIVVPLTITTVSLLVAFIEIRVGMQYIATALGLNWQLPECTLRECDIFDTSKQGR